MAGAAESGSHVHERKGGVQAIRALRGRALREPRLGCWFFYQRAGHLLATWLPALLPSPPPGRWRRAQTAVVVALGALSTINFLMHDGQGEEASQARAIIAAVPLGAKVAPVLDLAPNESKNAALRPATGSDALVWAHFPAYAVALRDAEITWMFAREHGHFPVRLRVSELELPPVDYGWAMAFHPSADYAREFEHVLVLVGREDPTRDPRASVFGEAAAQAIVLAHHGRFWLFEHTRPRPERASAAVSP